MQTTPPLLHTFYSLHTAETHIQPYLHSIPFWTKSNNLNSDKRLVHYLTPDPAEYSTKLNPRINKIILDLHTSKILGLILNPKLTHNKHIDNTEVKATETITK